MATAKTTMPMRESDRLPEEGELLPEATHKKYLLVRTEGGREDEWFHLGD